MGSNLLRIAVVLALVPLLGYAAIATGYVIAVNIALVLLLVMLRRHIPDLDLRALAVGLARIVAASVVAGIAGWAAFALMWPDTEKSQLVTMLVLLFCFALALPVYYLTALLLRSPEAAEAGSRIRALMTRSG
jgi:peptidoglycan biosynthesis protein MviN/MurJ (putative lipid II flippase)